MSAKYERRFFTGATEKPVNDTELRKDPDGEPSGFNPVSVFIEPLQEHPNHREHALVPNPFRHPTHQHVVVDPIKEFLEIDVDHPPVALRDHGLRVGYGLMS